MRRTVSEHYLAGGTMKRITDAIPQILMGVLLAVMAAETYTAGPNVSSPALVTMATVAVVVAVRELCGRRQAQRDWRPCRRMNRRSGSRPPTA